MAYDPDEMIAYRGKMITKDVIWHKVKGLGWNTRLFGMLDDSEMIKVMEERKTPAQMGKSMETTFVPNQQPAAVVDINDESVQDPSVMGPMGTQPHIEPPMSPAGAVSESGVAPVAITPPAYAGKHLRPVDPTKGGVPSQPVPQPQGPMAGTTGYAPPPRPITVKPPKTDTAKLMSMLDAAFSLAGNDATVNTAKVLVTTNGLERAFQAMYPELAKKVLGRMDMTPDSKCRGGTILDIELEADNGYVHIITSAGTITITGTNLIHKGAEA
jgi:hypothetical protein